MHKQNTSQGNNITNMNKAQCKKITKDMISFKAEPLTENIKKAMESFDDGRNMIIDGCPGTGKTFVVLNKSIQKVLSGDNAEFRSITIFRSIVPVRNIGFLKGTKEEKCEEYESPYIQIVNETFASNGDNIYTKLKETGIINFQSTSFNQGITVRDSLIIVDEPQNMTYSELFNVITRCGENTRIYFTGDYKKQDMLKSGGKDNRSGFKKFINVINSHEKLRNTFDIIEMTPEDVVRSGLCKLFVEADYNYIEKD